MQKFDHATGVRVEIVTTTFVAAGKPEGIHDLGRFLETLNNPVLSRQLELRAPAVRPLYRATAQVQLEAPLLVRRDDMIFANFDGPFFARGAVRPSTMSVPVLLMAPPFQICGAIDVPIAADATQALRAGTQGFFTVKHATVLDAEGNLLGEGDQIVVNGAAVQMASATRQRIEPAAAVARRPEPRAEAIEQDEAPEREVARAA